MKRLVILPLLMVFSTACMWWAIPQYGGGYDDAPPPAVEVVPAVPTGPCQFDSPTCDTGVFLTLPQSTGAFGLPTIGDSTARVAVRVFMDFMCPHCANFSPILAELIAAYGDTVRFEYVPMTFVRDPQSKDAAKVALCASEQGVFWQYQHALFVAQRYGELDGAASSLNGFIDFGTERGMDADDLTACLDSTDFAYMLDGAQTLADRQAVTSTPSVTITADGGETWTTYTGERTFSGIAAELDAALE